MITMNQAMSAREFTHIATGNRVRRSGKTQTWKTRPGEFKIPVKFGLYQSLYIWHSNAAEYEVRVP